LWAVLCSLILLPNWREGAFYLLFFSTLFLMLTASQVFWVVRFVDLGERFIPGKLRRGWLMAIASIVCLFFFAYNIGPWAIPRGNSTHLTLRSILLQAPFWWWFVGSWVGFGLVMVFWTIDRAGRAAAWVYRQTRKAAAGHAAPVPAATAIDPPPLARRQFLEHAAVTVAAVPFLAAAYGLLYGRLDLEVTRQRIALARLPKAFEGFRIVQLSDFHISPFMTAEKIRRCVTIANGLKADLVALTGDYVADDPEAQAEVVQALADDSGGNETVGAFDGKGR